MSIEWKQSEYSSRVYPSGVGYVGPSFTVEDLEAGLKLAREKPVFAVVAANGCRVEYQKRDGKVMLRAPGVDIWHSLDRWEMSEYNADELEAIAKALRS